MCAEARVGSYSTCGSRALPRSSTRFLVDRSHTTVDGHALRKRLRGTPILARVPGTQRARQDDVTLSRRRHRRCGARAAEAAGARGRVGLRHQRVPVSAVGGRVQIRDAVRARGGGRGALRLHRARRGRRTSPPEAETNRADHLGGGEGARLLRRALSRPPPRRVPRHRCGPDPCRPRSRTHSHRPLASRTHASARASRRLGRRYPKVDVSNPPRVRRRVPSVVVFGGAPNPSGISLRQPLREGTSLRDVQTLRHSPEIRVLSLNPRSRALATRLPRRTSSGGAVGARGAQPKRRERHPSARARPRVHAGTGVSNRPRGAEQGVSGGVEPRRVPVVQGKSGRDWAWTDGDGGGGA